QITIPAGGGTQVKVRFNPPSDGYYSDLLTITSDVYEDAFFNVGLEGSGAGGNSPPMINNPVENEVFYAQEGMEFMLYVDAYDPDGDPLTFTTAGPGYFMNLNEYRWTPAAGDVNSEHPITIEVSDNINPPVIRNFKIFVNPAVTNSPPMINNPMENQLFNAQEGMEFMFTIDASDPDGDPLTFIVTAGPGYFMNVNEYRWAPAAGDVNSEHPITIEVSDGINPPVTRNFKIFVAPAVTNIPPVIDYPYENELFNIQVGQEFIHGIGAYDS
ncbi:unnamed protein product, partial [marine sediment metagenome]